MKSETNSWLKVELKVPPALTEALENFFDEIGLQGTYQEALADAIDEGEQFQNSVAERLAGEKLIAFLPNDIRVAKRIALLEEYLSNLKSIFPELPTISFSLQNVENPDWNEEWKKYFKPLRIGKHIIIKPSWERYNALSNDVVVEIDPGMAFGTGQHDSTRMCLEAIEEVVLSQRNSGWKMLDVGTGTGILAIAAAKFGVNNITAIDVDKNAISIANENATLNNVNHIIIFREPELGYLTETFNLITANLTAKVLLQIRNGLFSSLAVGGYMLISGIIEANTCEIERAFFSEQIICSKKKIDSGWACYIVHRQR